MRSLWSLMVLLLVVCGGAVLLGGCVEGSSGSITLLVYAQAPYDTPTAPVWAAFQDGDTPWRVIAPNGVGVYSQPLSDGPGRYGFALVDVYGDFHLVHGVLSEGAQCVYYLDSSLSFSRAGDRKDSRPPPPGAYYAQGAISYSGFTPGDSSSQFFGSHSSSSPITVYGETVPAGVYDLAVRNNGWTDPWETTWVWLERGIAVAAPLNHDVTVNDGDRIMLLNSGASLAAAAGVLNAYVYYRTANGTPIILARGNSLASPLPFRTMPPASAVAGDIYSARVSGSGWMKTVFFANPAGATVTAPTT
ncbi:MAG: hypothetical protein ACYC7E_23435, partial [Armatimonadota bacterium]